MPEHKERRHYVSKLIHLVERFPEVKETLAVERLENKDSQLEPTAGKQDPSNLTETYNRDVDRSHRTQNK